MTEIINSKRYDLEDRTLRFVKDVRILNSKIPKNVVSIEDCKQLTRSSGSMGANYIEANESLSKKDFILRIKICRKESKETIYWLRLISNTASENKELVRLISEATELMKIFSAILKKSE